MERTFTLTITGTEHHEWQGLLTSEGTQTAFRSVLELLHLMNSAVTEITDEHPGNEEIER
jgi:hypothetical protein